MADHNLALPVSNSLTGFFFPGASILCASDFALFPSNLDIAMLVFGAAGPWLGPDYYWNHSNMLEWVMSKT